MTDNAFRIRDDCFALMIDFDTFNDSMPHVRYLYRPLSKLEGVNGNQIVRIIHSGPEILV